MSCRLVLGLCAAAVLTAGCPAGREPGQAASPRVGPPAGVWHQARAGESPVLLARRYGVALEDIVEINGLEQDSALMAGQVVFIPGGRPLPPGGLPAAAAATQAAPSPPSGQAQQGQPTRLLWPVPGGTLTSGFGPRGARPHEGIDIAAPEGTQVLAAAAGRVIYAGSGVRGYGNLILLRHPDGLVTIYAHNRANFVREKEEVKAGQVIAEVGRTGNASACHLHFEVRRGETPEDPLAHVRPLR